jgi:hypothetical protein
MRTPELIRQAPRRADGHKAEPESVRYHTDMAGMVADGAMQRRAFTAMGTAINLAAWLHSQVQPGQTPAGDVVHPVRVV